jgi:hypothetical protein
MTARPLTLRVLLCAVLLLPLRAYTQSGATGAISGVVADANGNPISNAQIEITAATSETATRTVFSDASGNFMAPSLHVGDYEVVVKAGGLSTSKYSGVTVRLTETTRLNPSLAAASGLKSEAITGGAEQVEELVLIIAPPVVAVETSTSATGRTLQAGIIRNLPLATQNFHQLLTLSAGVMSELNASAQLGRGDVGIHVNGQRQDNNNYLLDGISVTDLRNSELFNTPLPSPDAVQEFKVQTSLYDATEGRNGGGIINAVLKTGTTRWHGAAFEFFRNDVPTPTNTFKKGRDSHAR